MCPWASIAIGVEFATLVIPVHGLDLPVLSVKPHHALPNSIAASSRSGVFIERDAGAVAAIERDRGIVSDDLGIQGDGLHFPRSCRPTARN